MALTTFKEHGFRIELFFRINPKKSLSTYDEMASKFEYFEKAIRNLINTLREKSYDIK